MKAKCPFSLAFRKNLFLSGLLTTVFLFRTILPPELSRNPQIYNGKSDMFIAINDDLWYNN
jgi:hypothetical protein